MKLATSVDLNEGWIGGDLELPLAAGSNPYVVLTRNGKVILEKLVEEGPSDNVAPTDPKARAFSFKFVSAEFGAKLGNIYQIEITSGGQTLVSQVLFGNPKVCFHGFATHEVERGDVGVFDGTPTEVLDQFGDFVGLKRLLIRLRRGKRGLSHRGVFKGSAYPHYDDDWEVFKSFVECNKTTLFKIFNARYLWSLLDTFADHGRFEDRLAALAVSNLLAQERFAQTFRCIFDFVEKADPILNRQITYWGGMATNRLNGDDSYDIVLTRNLELLANSPLIRAFFCEIVLRSIDEPNSIFGVNIHYGPYFQRVKTHYQKELARYR